MHFYFYLRGIYSQVEVYKTLAQSQFYKWKRFNLKTNEEEFILVQGALRLSVMGVYEYVFPEEALPEVLSFFAVSGEEKFLDRQRLRVLRVILGASPIPKEALKKSKEIPSSIMLNEYNRGLSNMSLVQGVSLHPIGVKKDKFGDFLGYYQELL